MGEIVYTVWFKSVEQEKWTRIDNVKADLLVDELKARVFITSDEARYEIPLGCMFKFSKERFFAITQDERNQIGK